MDGKHRSADAPASTGGSTTDAGPDRRPVLIRAALLVVLVLGWLGIGAVGGPAIGSLSSVQSNDQATFLPADAESVEAAAAAKLFNPNGSLPALVVFSAGAPASPAQRASWAVFAAGLGSLPVAPAAGTVGDYLVPGPLIVLPSADGAAGLLVVPLAQQKVTARDADGKPSVGPVVDAIRVAAVAAAAGAAAHVAGPAGIVSDLVKAFAGIDGILLLVAVLAVLSILVLVYRAVVLPFLVLLCAVSALALAGWVVYHLADAGRLTVSGQSQGILFILVVGAATDYGLLLVSRYREELARNDSTWPAMRRAWRACLGPISASAGTVVIGLLCLTLSALNSNRSLGPVGAIGIAAAYLSGLTLLPALLLLGRWVFWPRVPRRRPDDQVLRAPTGLWARIAAGVARRPRRVWVITAVVLAAACTAVPSFKASGTAQTDVFLADVDSVAGQRALVQHFPGGSGSPVVIIAPTGSAAAVVAAAAAVPGVTSAAPAPALPGIPATVNGLVQVLAVLTDAPDSESAQDTVRAIRVAVHAASPPALVGGQTAILVDTRAAADRDLRVIIPLILLAVLIVLILLLRSLVAPLVVIAATVLSFGTALGISALVFNHVFDFPGGDPGVPLYAFVFLVALGIDYSIFLMTRAREEVAAHGPRDGVLRALRLTGGVITSAGLVLAATFAALGVIPILFLAQIAFIVAFGVLLDTLIVRSLLVPALAVDLGRYTWWPGALGRRTR